MVTEAAQRPGNERIRTLGRLADRCCPLSDECRRLALQECLDSLRSADYGFRLRRRGNRQRVKQLMGFPRQDRVDVGSRYSSREEAGSAKNCRIASSNA